MSQTLKHIVAARKMDSGLKQTALQHQLYIEDLDFLVFRYNDNEKIVQQIANNEQPWVFTSQHAVKALVQLIATHGIQLNNKKAYCIAGKTQQLAAKHNFLIQATAVNASHLAQEIIRQKEQAVFHATTNKKRYELYEALAAANVPIQSCELYSKQAQYHSVRAFDGVLFFSPSQVDAFLEKNKLAAETPAFCIGQTTAHHLINKKHQNIIVAKKASEQAMLAALINYFENTD